MISVRRIPISGGAKNVLLFGGTFDPPHRGHIEPAFAACNAIGADCLVYIPAARSPHKQTGPTIPDADRITLLKAAIRDSLNQGVLPDGVPHPPEVGIATIEIEAAQAGSPSYTIETLRTLRKEVPPEITFRLLIGADQAVAFHRWREPDEIAGLAEPVVMLRPPYATPESFRRALETEAPPEQCAVWLSRVVQTPILDINATQLREALAEENYEAAAVRDALTPRVIEEIRKRRLYRKQ
ncbi:MAG: nicotinate-nicotinamide nucleotide adenylyltransferase [Phycisphaeraceae bacterium]|nr:MAG: nicotinate-nicotinamide nucleotide adenylyltransferase [Phycisphaeraceae bacterium]